MSEYSSFFNSVVDGAGIYDREYNAEDFAEYFASFVGNGVYADKASELQVTAYGGNMSVVVHTGSAWINGYYYKNASNKNLTLTIADGALNRTDLIVVRLDLIERMITAEIVEGTPDTVGTVPELTRDSDVYEIALASIYIPANSTEISQANITDLRSNNNYCGWVSGVITQMDTTGLFAQFTDAFETWFDHVKGQLSTDVAGNLQLEIDDINVQISGLNVVYYATFDADDWMTMEVVNGKMYNTNSVTIASAIPEHASIGLVPITGKLPTEAEQEAYDTVNYFTVEPVLDALTDEPTGAIITGYSEDTPEADFKVVIKG